MLNLERLRTLDALARHGSVSGAAEGLHVTTSAVSQQMAKLEREVGQQLLAKNGRGVRLTDAGRLLAEHAARILSQVELAQSDLEAQRGQVVGELRLVGVPDRRARTVPRRAVRAARASTRPCGVRSCELEPETGIAGVVRGDLDLAVVLDWYNKPMPLPDGLVKAHILDDPADVAMPAGHRLAGRDEVDLAEFADDEWITWGEGEFCHEWLMFTLRSKGIEPHRRPPRRGEPHPARPGRRGTRRVHRAACWAATRCPAAVVTVPAAAAGAPACVRRLARGRRPPPVDPGGGARRSSGGASRLG